MYLKINSVRNLNNSFIVKQQNKKNAPTIEQTAPEALSHFYNNITFNGSSALKKPTFTNKNIQKVADKIASLYQQLPEFSYVKKPFQIPYEKGVAAFTIDKSQDDITKISLKIKEKSKQIKDWDSFSEFDKGMDMLINKKGQMVEGVYYEAGGCHLIFKKQPKKLRRILYKHNQYIPKTIEKYYWERIAGGEKIFSTSEKIPVDQDKIEVLFFEMAEPRTSLLAKK